MVMNFPLNGIPVIGCECGRGGHVHEEESFHRRTDP